MAIDEKIMRKSFDWQDLAATWLMKAKTSCPMGLIDTPRLKEKCHDEEDHRRRSALLHGGAGRLLFASRTRGDGQPHLQLIGVCPRARTATPFAARCSRSSTATTITGSPERSPLS
jgi:hypothetical protein